MEIIAFDIYIYNYFKKWMETIYPKKKKNDYGIFFLITMIHLFHLCIILFFIFGIFLPSKYLLFYVIFWILMLSSWYIFYSCPLNLITYKLGGEYYNFFNISILLRNIIVILAISISLIGYKNERLSLHYNLIKFLKYFIKKFDN